MWPFRKKKDEEKTHNDQPSGTVVVSPVIEKVTRAQKEIMESYKDGGNNLAQSNEENYISTSELVFSCVDYIAKAASQATPRLYEIDPKTGDKKPVKDKKLAAWVNQPNPFWTWNDLLEMTVQGILLSGGSYLTLEMVKGAYETWYLGPPSKVNIVPDKSKYIKGYIYDDKVTYKPEEVCYIKNPTLNNAYYGMPAVRPLLDTLLLEASAIDELATFYKGSNIISGVLKSELPLTPEQVEELREQFNSLYGQGGKYKRGTAILPAKMDYKPIQANPKDALLLDSMSISEQRVLRVFKLNALALGGEASSTTHPQELMRAVFNTAVRPYLYKIEAQMTLFLQRKFKKANLVFEFDFDKIVELETSLDVKSSAAKTLYATGVATMNEARDLVGLARLESKYADMNVLASYLFGTDFQYIQELSDTRQVPNTDIGNNNQPQGGAGSTSPDGGTPDMPTQQDVNQENTNVE
jgi:HK97 family phage portal protein